MVMSGSMVDHVKADYCYHEQSGGLTFTRCHKPDYHVNTVRAYAPGVWMEMWEVYDEGVPSE